jgi:hypothetical protein
MSEETPIKSGVAKFLTAAILVFVLSDFVPHATGETGLLSATIEQIQILWNSRDGVDFSSH